MTRDELTVDLFRSCGRSLRRGTPVRVPSLPSSKRSLTVLRLEAGRDAAVRFACETALARAAETERARQVEPQVLRRACGLILEIR